MKITMKDVMTANCQIPHAEMLTSNHCAALARELTAMFEAPVPPAGDVRVMRYGFRSEYVSVLPDELDRLEIHAAHLTAERDGARAELKGMGERYQKDLMLSRERWCYGNRADTKIAELQSELTKARELNPINWTDRQILDFLGVALRNVDLVGEVRLSEIRQGFRFMQERQYAPDAKGGSDE